MSYKQKNQRYNSQTEHYDEPYQELSKERKLVLAWQEDNINESYQSIVLKYLDQLSGKNLENEIGKQLQRCYYKSSYYHKIQFLLGERQKALSLLYECCCKMNGSMESNGYLQYDLESVCDLIDHVRKTSMYVSEGVWEMFEHFRFKTINKNSLSEGKHYIKIFASFDKDWSFLKESILRYYIPFTNNFDPLLIQAAKPLKKMYSENKLVYNQHVDELFRINASYLYRLLRAHQKILGYYMLTKDLEAIQQNKQIQTEQYSYEKAISHYSSSSKVEKTVQPTSKYQRPTIQQERKATMNRNGNKQKKMLRLATEEPKDNRKITRISQITINNHHQNQKQDNQEFSLPKKLQSTKPSQREVVSALSRFEEGQLKKQKRQSHTEPLDHSMYLSRNIDPNRQDLNEERPKKKQIKMAEKKPNIKRKKSKILRLPKLHKDEHLEHDQSSDCLCRQRYKSRLKQSSAEIPVEEAEQKRLTIIKKINQKYKSLAKKQIRYELSMMGDATYHKMKEKSQLKQRQKKKYSSQKQKNFYV